MSRIPILQSTRSRIPILNPNQMGGFSAGLRVQATQPTPSLVVTDKPTTPLPDLKVVSQAGRIPVLTVGKAVPTQEVQSSPFATQLPTTQSTTPEISDKSASLITTFGTGLSQLIDKEIKNAAENRSATGAISRMVIPSVLNQARKVVEPMTYDLAAFNNEPTDDPIVLAQREKLKQLGGKDMLWDAGVFLALDLTGGFLKGPKAIKELLQFKKAKQVIDIAREVENADDFVRAIKEAKLDIGVTEQAMKEAFPALKVAEDVAPKIAETKKTAEAVLPKSELDHLLSEPSTRTPSNKMVAPNLPKPGLETNLPSSLTKTTSPAGASKSILYSDPSQVKNLAAIDFNKLSPTDVSIIQKTNNVNSKPFSQALEQATGLVPDVRIKKADSLIGKVERYKLIGKNPAEIADNLGGRIVIKPDQIPTQLENIKKNFDVVEVQNFFDSPTEWGYQGINIKVKLPNGLLAEIQIHTPESLKIAGDIHPIYEKWRNIEITPKNTAAFQKDLAKSKKIVSDILGTKAITPQRLLGEPKPKQITRAEDVMLRERVRAEARGAKWGYTAGYKEAKKIVLNTIARTQEDVSKVKSSIINYTKQTLPPESRGKFLTALNNSKTQKDAIKIFTRIDNEAEQIAKKELVGTAKKTLAKILDSESVAVDYRTRAKEIANKIELQGHTQAKLEELQQTKKYFEQARAKGEDVFIPEKLQRDLEILNRKQKATLSVDELERLNWELNEIEKLGKTKQGARIALYEASKAQIATDLSQAAKEGKITPINDRGLIPRAVGEKLGVGERAKNIFKTILNKARRVDIAITPMDAFFKHGLGEEAYQNFKVRTDLNFQKFYNRSDEITEKFWQQADRLGMKDSNFERIGVYAAKEQTGGAEKLLASGLTKKEIEAIHLTSQEKTMYEYMRRELDAMRPEIEKVMKVNYNKELGKVENYFSFMTDWDNMTDLEMADRFGDNVPEFGQRTKKVEQGFIKTRVGGTQKIKLNAAEIFTKHIENASYFIEVGPDNAMLFEVANKPDMKEVLGDLGQRTTLDWLDLISRKGGKQEGKIPVLDTLRRNFGLAQLGLNATSALIQPTALFDGAAQIGSYAFKGMADVATDSSIRKFVLKNMPEIRKRIGDDKAFDDLFKTQFQKRIQKIAYYPLKKLDSITASAVGWGAYLKKLDEFGEVVDLAKPNKRALAYAQEIVIRTQGSGTFKDSPLAISRGSLTGNISFDRALLQFQTFALTRWSQIRNSLPAAIHNKNPKAAVNILFWLATATLAEEAIRRGIRKGTNYLMGKDTEESTSYGKAVLENAVSTVPFVSQVMSSIIYESTPVPAFESFSKIGQMFTGKTWQTKTKGAINTLGSLGGIPGTRQALKMIPPAKPESSSYKKNYLKSYKKSYKK